LENAKTTVGEADSLRRKKTVAGFEVADAALLAGCLDIADTKYKEILTTFTRAVDQAVRDRAKVGIDDVRAKLAR
jgi:hypothetical protein